MPYRYNHFAGGKSGGYPRETTPQSLKVMHERLETQRRSRANRKAALERLKELKGSDTHGGSFASRERKDVQHDLAQKGNLIELFEEIGE